jgi:large subunit ribosomal protein L25
VSCLPAALPEYIEVNLASLDIGESVHLSDLILPAGVEIIALAQGPEHDLPVVSMMASKTSKEEDVSEEASE